MYDYCFFRPVPLHWRLLFMSLRTKPLSRVLHASVQTFTLASVPQPYSLQSTKSVLLATLHLDQAGLCHLALLKAKFPEFS